MRSIFVSSQIDTGTEPKVACLLDEKKQQIKKRDNCRISTQEDTTEEIRTKIKRKRTVCDAKSGKRKLFPLSLVGGGFIHLIIFYLQRSGFRAQT